MMAPKQFLHSVVPAAKQLELFAADTNSKLKTQLEQSLSADDEYDVASILGYPMEAQLVDDLQYQIQRDLKTSWLT